jgi:hypothetical protein
VFRLASWVWVPADGVGAGVVAPGVIAGNRPAALPAPMSELDALLRFGSGPSGSTACAAVPAADLDADGDGVAAVTVIVSSAEGGVHFAVVTMLAVAVSFSDVTEVAPDATGIWACRATGF